MIEKKLLGFPDNNLKICNFGYFDSEFLWKNGPSVKCGCPYQSIRLTKISEIFDISSFSLPWKVCAGFYTASKVIAQERSLLAKNDISPDNYFDILRF